MEHLDLPRHYACAGPTCAKSGTSSCKGCLLVNYCGPECQKAHWPDHKTDCKSSLMKESWRPQWEAGHRKPSFIGGSPVASFNHQKKYLWGNVPAYDVLQLNQNEGSSMRDDLNLLFAASGDLRNVFETIRRIPQTYDGNLLIVLNDRDAQVTARNVITLLMLFQGDDDDQKAAQNVVHLWYSAFVHQGLIEKIHGDVRDAIEAVCSKIEKRPANTIQAKTFQFGQRRLRLLLKQSDWLGLRQYLQPPAVSSDTARRNRLAVTLAPERIDHRERAFFRQKPAHRFCSHTFREKGVLLPYGAPQDAFKTPNPTLFERNGTWLLMDSADPLNGWSWSDVKSARGTGSNDVYGKLYFHVFDIVSSVYKLLRGFKVEFQVHSIDAKDLPMHVKGVQFDRIETANIADSMYLNAAQTVHYLGPLLKSPQMNPCATLITLFMNSVAEVMTPADEMADLEEGMRILLKYLPQVGGMPSRHDAELLRRVACCDLVRDFDKYFDRYTTQRDFEQLCNLVGMKMKEKHTIIEKWPMRLKKRAGQAGAQQEFEDLMASGHTGCERYVEWCHTG